MKDISGLKSILKTEIIYTIKKMSISEAVIVYFARLQGALEMNLKTQLRGVRNKLPVFGFANEVKLAYNIGLISSSFKRDLLLVGKIRNCLVHYNPRGSKSGTSWHIGLDEKRLNENADKLISNMTDFLKKFHDIRMMVYPNHKLGAVIIVMIAMIRVLMIPDTKPPKIPIVQTGELYKFE